MSKLELITEELIFDDLGGEFEALLERNSDITSFSAGDIIKGKLIRIDKDGALIDVGFKSEGFLPSKEVANREEEKTVEDVLEFDKEYDFYVIREENEKGPLLLSYKRVAQARGWAKLEEIKTKDEIVEGVVFAVVKGGVVVEIHGVRGFVPASQLRSTNEADTDKGATLRLKIIELNKNSRKLICSRKVVIEEEKANLREKALVELEVGQVISGSVVRVAEFGAFVDIGGIDGLLPVSEISWQRINHPKEKLSVGDQISVKVLKIDESGKISLSLKRLEQDPWTEIEDKFVENQIVKGSVVKITAFGAFIEIYPGVEGLLPSNEISDDEDATPDKFLDVGQEVEVIIKKLSPYERRILLSMKDIEQVEL
ncbi:MAG: S1 RNA-binding domain-containing protein [Candidatus Caenarcaniphilales bacterium]|nr:S1 RNA-binding domain-containing protein [Candidatus Caenarcaniphilales bacterium]